jgi:hypothetical protein
VTQIPTMPPAPAALETKPPTGKWSHVQIGGRKEQLGKVVMGIGATQPTALPYVGWCEDSDAKERGTQST